MQSEKDYIDPADLQSDIAPEERTELDIADMLFYFGHRALGLTEREAIEIDPYYSYDL